MFQGCFNPQNLKRLNLIRKISNVISFLKQLNENATLKNHIVLSKALKIIQTRYQTLITPSFRNEEDFKNIHVFSEQIKKEVEKTLKH